MEPGNRKGFIEPKANTMILASELQRKKLAPMLLYFHRKSCEREEQYIADKRFVASIKQLIRAEEKDQTEWMERRQRRLRAGTPSPTLPLQPKENGATSPPGQERALAAFSPRIQDAKRPESAACTPGTGEDAFTEEPQANRTPPHSTIGVPQERTLSTKFLGRTRASQIRKTEGCPRRRIRKGRDRHKRQTLNIAQVAARVSQLESIIRKDPDPQSVAAEMAALYLVLSEHRSALKSFQLAMAPSPERIPTKQEIDEKEIKLRKLVLLNKEKRAKTLAEMEAQDDARRRERETADQERKRDAATGIYRCLLELKQPVQAAEAARMRLRMCQTEDERRQVVMEIHESLLASDGLFEDEATNQGAWLTESAGALRDLHASVLASLLESEHASNAAHDDPSAASGGKKLREIRRIVESTNSDSPKGLRGDSPQIDGKLFGVIRGGVENAPAGVGGNVMVVPWDFSEAQRTRLCELGRLLACKRQFATSRQAFDDAMRGGPAELCLRERNKAHSPGFFLDMAPRESTPMVRLDLKSRWQGGVETDEARLRALADFAGFAGVHRGADTLVATPPSTGWSDGSSDLAYAERLSRSRMVVGPLRTRDGAKAPSPLTANEEERVSGLMLGHVVPAEDVAHP